MLRTKGEAGTGNVVEAVRHARAVQKEIRMVRQRGEKDREVNGRVMGHSFCCVLLLFVERDSSSRATPPTGDQGMINCSPIGR